MNIVPIDADILNKIKLAHSELQQLRGEPNLEYDQYYVEQNTSIERALLFDPDNYNQARIALLGDMDLSSLTVGMLSKPRDLAVIDIDKRIPEIVFKMKFDYKIKSIRFVNQDIRIRMIAVLKNQFDYIFLEPSMTTEGLEVWLTRAVQCAKKDTPSHIVLSYDIEEENKEIVDNLVELMNLEIVDKLINFNKYEYSTPLGKKNSDLYILKVKSTSTETIPNHYYGPLYYRESTNVPHPYKCKCGQIHDVGESGEYIDINDLHQKGCPECDYEGPFLFKSSVLME